MKDKEHKQLQNAEVVDWLLKFLAGYFLSKTLDYLLKLLWSLRKPIKANIFLLLKPIKAIIKFCLTKSNWIGEDNRGQTLKLLMEEFPLTVDYIYGLSNRGFIDRLFGSPTLPV